MHTHVHTLTLSLSVPSCCTSSYTPGTGGGQRSPCSEFSGFRGYTQHHGDVVGWGQPRSAVRHQDGSGHVGGDPAGQEQGAVGHLRLVARPLQRNGLEGTSSLASGTTWGTPETKIPPMYIHFNYNMLKEINYYIDSKSKQSSKQSLPSLRKPSVPETGPGATVLTRTPLGPHSTARCLVIASGDGRGNIKSSESHLDIIM